MTEIPLVHTLKRLQDVNEALGTVRENSEKVERTIHFFECLWHWLLYTALIENLTVKQPRNQGAFDGLSRPSDGSYLGMIRKILKSGKDLKYTGLLREILQVNKYKANSDVPVVLVAQAMYKLLGLKGHLPGSLNLMEFFSLIISFRNMRKLKEITEETARQVIEVMDEQQFVSKMLATFELVQNFQLGFIRQVTGTNEQAVILIQGSEIIGKWRKTLTVDATITPSTVYLFDLSEEGKARVVGSGEPFFKVGNSQSSHATTLLYFYSTSSTTKNRYTLDYISHVSQDTIQDQGDLEQNPLRTAIKFLNGEVDEPVDVDEQDGQLSQAEVPASKKHSERAAGGKPETGYLAVKFLPPLAGVRVKVYREADRSNELASVVSRHNGITEEMDIPKGQVVVVAKRQFVKRETKTDIQVISPVVDIYTDDNRTLVMGLPYSLSYSVTHMQIVQKLYDIFKMTRRHWKSLAFLSLLPFSLILIGLIIYQHFSMLPPERMFYVEPIEYSTGIIPADSPQGNIASNLLKVISKHVRSPMANMSILSAAIFKNSPHAAELDNFFIDKTEVTVERYLNYLKVRKEELSEDEFKTLIPDNLDNWEKQLYKAQTSGNKFLAYPVHSINWTQANSFCEYYGGKLPMSDEWEVVARNLKKGEPTSGTLYPWGNVFIPGITQTTEWGEINRNYPVEVCSMSDKNKHSVEPVCDLGGNLQEWTRTLDGWGIDFIIRSQKYDDSGTIGALGFIIRREESKDFASTKLGFRCVYYKQPKNIKVAQYPAGKYHHLGYPNDANFKLLARYYDKLEYLVKEPTIYEDVGDFFVMSRKVTNGEYAEFYRNTDKGRGSWSKEIDEPKRHKHILPKSGRPNDPVLGISWYSAHAYCAYHGMRLPTAEEWERIIRGNSGNLFPWGMEENPIQYEKFMNKATGEVHQLIRSMWTDGPEWTRTKGWQKDEETRIIKGLQIEKGKGRSYLIAYLITTGQPHKASEVPNRAGFRCVLDRKPTLSEQLFGLETSNRLTENPVQWPPKQ